MHCGFGNRPKAIQTMGKALDYCSDLWSQCPTCHMIGDNVVS